MYIQNEATKKEKLKCFIKGYSYEKPFLQAYMNKSLVNWVLNVENAYAPSVISFQSYCRNRKAMEELEKELDELRKKPIPTTDLMLIIHQLQT
jgi:hypothetical protein